jgi:hypothetical protein
MWNCSGVSCVRHSAVGFNDLVAHCRFNGIRGRAAIAPAAGGAGLLLVPIVEIIEQLGQYDHGDDGGDDGEQGTGIHAGGSMPLAAGSGQGGAFPPSWFALSWRSR